MPNKNKREQLAIQRAFYARHKEEEKQRVKRRREEIKVWFREHKKQYFCRICGENEPVCIDFHHIDGKGKHGAVNTLLHQGVSKKTLEEEIAKCVPLCGNCHRKEHYKEKYGTGQIRIRR